MKWVGLVPVVVGWKWKSELFFRFYNLGRRAQNQGNNGILKYVKMAQGSCCSASMKTLPTQTFEEVQLMQKNSKYTISSRRSLKPNLPQAVV